MDYRETKKQLLINNLSQSGMDYRMDGVHAHVLDKAFTDANIVPSVRNLGYATQFSKKGTIVSIANSQHRFKLDFRANNLTSSSMLSACFFALNVENQPQFKRMIESIFEEQLGQRIHIESDIDVQLEWIDEEGDESHIDALITFIAGNKPFRIFVEIKYCESAYGPKKTWEKQKMSEQEKEKARAKYIDSCKRCYDRHREKLSIDGFMDHCITQEDYKKSKYCRRYQIIRNVSHASLKTNDYCWFLLAKGNEEAVADILNGLDDLREQNSELIKQRVAVVFFEDLLDKDSDLYQKYFA